ncbi:MerR family transcriptional regulator [Rhizobium phaseoli]|uniref:MerR family transcriptional regulator n=1 Tax=Rhizobium phaseoli TaxID=396 RepID=UPI000BE8036A|nr:MerR family transcriptional regulator [Rhizobium phaseoli]PDS30250.1 MerR family transcriptional regulator [Rhizobium phaseoli]
MSKQYKVSELSLATGVPAATLRLWEQHGLIVPMRTASGYRMYSDEDFARVHQIVRLRSVQGLNLAAIKSALNELDDVLPATSGDEAPVPRLGFEIRRLRKQNKLTISALAKLVDVSTSTISTLERTSRGASVPLLRAVAQALGVTVTQLTAGPPQATKSVVRTGEGRQLPTLGKGITIRELASGPRMMDCQEWTLSPGAGSEGFYRHEGEEFIRVLEGSFEVEVDGLGIATLNEGDSIYFESNRAHSWRSVGPTPCRLLWVNTPPTF